MPARAIKFSLCAWLLFATATIAFAQQTAEDLAAALARVPSEAEQERLLAREKDRIDRSLLAALKAQTDSHLQKGAYAEALRLSQLVARLAEKLGDRHELGKSLHDLARIHARQNQTAQALDYFQKSVAIYEEVNDKPTMARVLFEMGRTYALQSRPDEALASFNRSLAISEAIQDKKSMALALNALGIGNRAQGRNEIALAYYQKSLALSEDLKDKVIKAKVLNNMGDLYIFEGRYTEALTCLQQAVKTNESLGGAMDKLGMGYHLHNIAQVYRLQGRYEQALEYNRKSLKLREEINDKEGIGGSQNNIGVVYKSQGLHEQALEWFQKGLKSFQEALDTDGVAIALSNMGDIYRQQKRYDLALEYLQKSLRLHEEISGRVGIAQALRDLSWLYYDQGNYSEMLEISRRAAKLAEEINAPQELWTSQESMGRALRALGQPAQARQSFLAAIATIESLRHQVAGGRQQQQSFLENKLAPWFGMIDLLVSQKESVEAFTFAERAKARVLLDVLQTGRTNIQRALSPQERQEEEQQQQRLVALNSQLSRESLSLKPNRTLIADLKSQLAKARLASEALETALYVAHPELKINRGELTPITLAETASLLTEQTAWLEFAVGQDKTHLFVITKNNTTAELKTYSLPLKRKDLAERTEQFRRYLAEKDLRHSQPARALYDSLLKPAAAQLQGKTRLIIVPEGPLWELPFQALMSADNRFLIEDYAISLAPSLTVLREMIRVQEKRNKTTEPATLLAIGNPALGHEMLAQRAELMGDKLEPLPFAEQQALQLGQLYKAKAKVFIGAAATEQRFKAEAGRYRILHLATHGVLDDRNPMYSHLVFAQTGTAEKEDGLLEARELLEMDLQAELAILSACETGRGRVSAGEGLVGLTWALFVAGVPSTVVSQWKVADKSTAELMVEFHKQLQAQNGKAENRETHAEALRRAALSLMKQPAYRHPFHWAGFVLVGNGF